MTPDPPPLTKTDVYQRLRASRPAGGKTVSHRLLWVGGGVGAHVRDANTALRAVKRPLLVKDNKRVKIMMKSMSKQNFS